MVDPFSPEKRKQIMTSIKSKNSKAELLVFGYLRKQGVYFQKHYSRAVGTPDIALPRKRKACFIDGDFWHGRRLPELVQKRGNEDYWTKKIKNNVIRDRVTRKRLRDEGWELLVVWESDILRKSTRNEVLKNIIDFLTTENGSQA
jgi:DNA mismatch endonuclease (patch repair protein)